jgi:protein-S-isoprenylcysteine O-methyltransferase Ste14
VREGEKVRKPPLPVFVALGSAFHTTLYSTLARVAARGDRRVGWNDGHPGLINRAGAGLGALGVGMLAWAAAGHHEATARDAALSVRPDYLAERGAYAITRNPLYVGGMAVWFGWALWFGSRRSAIAGALWLAGLMGLGVPYEERLLRAKFGDVYRDYQARVPRWL